MEQKTYQKNFSKIHSHIIGYDQSRKIKSQKTIAVIKDYFNNDLKNLNVLEIGCHKGGISFLLSSYFKNYYAIDIDRYAINIAIKHYQLNNLKFQVGNAESLNFKDAFFDMVICSHIYEHVPHAEKMMQEIYRVLKKEGVCYFSAANRLNLMEAHYKLPFLSIIPKPVAHIYLRICNKGKYYYETHLTYWGLKKLVSNFKIYDYTDKIIKNPQKFAAEDMFKDKTLKQRLSISIYKYFRFLFPTYIWILKKLT